MEAHIRRLLFSEDLKNVHLALHLIEGQGLAQAMHQDLLLAATLCDPLRPATQAIRRHLGPAADQYQLLFDRNPDVDKLLWLARQPGIPTETLVEVGALIHPRNGRHGWFLAHAQESHLRQWLPDAKQVNLKGHALLEFPKALRHLSEARAIDLAENQIGALPDWLPSLHRLERLSLRANPIAALAASVADLFLLRALDLGLCPNLADIKALRKAPSLTTLDIARCPGLPPGHWQHLPLGLETLTCSLHPERDDLTHFALPPRLHTLKIGGGHHFRPAQLHPAQCAAFPHSLEALAIHDVDLPSLDAFLAALPEGLRVLALTDARFPAPARRRAWPVRLHTLALPASMLPAVEDWPPALEALTIQGKAEVACPPPPPALRSLRLDAAMLTRVVGHGAELPHVTSVRLEGRIEDVDAVIAILAAMPVLERLNLARRSGRDAVQQIQARLPRLSLQVR